MELSEGDYYAVVECVLILATGYRLEGFQVEGATCGAVFEV